MTTQNSHDESYRVTMIASSTSSQVKCLVVPVSVPDDGAVTSVLCVSGGGTDRTGIETPEDVTALIHLSPSNPPTFTNYKSQVHVGSILGYHSNKIVGVEQLSKFSWT